MNLINKLSDEELKMFDNYRYDYAIDGSCGHIAPITDILKPWESAKSDYLYNLLGENFIISKEVKCMKTKEELSNKINDLLNGYIGHSKLFITEWKNFIYKKFTELKLDRSNPEFVMYYNMDQLMLEDCLLSNVFDRETFYVYFPNGDKYKVQRGCKVSKALGKIAEAFGLKGYEDFRIAHSQVLNEKELKGTMHLSIHPLDYATMSDNECDWNSCMNWREGGEYRRGTVEMMNSSCVVVAYLSSSENMKIRGGEWSNKKWRELFIVNKDIISGIKGYPYWNRELEKIALDWIKELAEKSFGYFYTDKSYACYNASGNSPVEIEELDKTIRVELVTDAMYNDCYDNCYMYFNKDVKDDIYVFYSGASQCMCCGSTTSSFSCEEMLYCDDCDDAVFCDKCGCRIEDDYDCYEVDGVCYCRYCYDDLPYCKGCDSVTTSDLTRVYLKKDNKVFRWNYADLCYDCINYNEYFNASDLITCKIDSGWERTVTCLPVTALDLSDKEVLSYLETVFEVYNVDEDLVDNHDNNTWDIVEERKESLIF